MNDNIAKKDLTFNVLIRRHWNSSVREVSMAVVLQRNSMPHVYTISSKLLENLQKHDII